MQRYFCNIVNDRYKLNKEDSHHITKVMRCSVGDKIEIVDNGSLFIAEIIELTPIVIAKVKEKVNMEENKDNIEIDVKKASEPGQDKAWYVISSIYYDWEKMIECKGRIIENMESDD